MSGASHGDATPMGNHAMTLARDDVDIWDRSEMEPRIRYVLERTLRLRDTGPYRPKSDTQVTDMLTRFFEAKGLEDIVISGVERMSGGASKEQFAFTLGHRANPSGERLVLRMDPLEAIAQTCRGREGEIQKIMGTICSTSSSIGASSPGPKRCNRPFACPLARTVG
jgi:hypothetical protein